MFKRRSIKSTIFLKALIPSSTVDNLTLFVTLAAFEINKLDEVEIQTIGLDENVKKMLLSDATLKKLQPPLSDMTQSAYEAIARVDHLQYELM